MVVSVASGLPAFRAGQIKMLGVGSPKRMPQVPDVPTVSESGLPGYQATAWFGLFGPAGTPRDIVMKLDKEVITDFQRPGVPRAFPRSADVRIDGRAAGRIRRLYQGRARQMGEGHSRRRISSWNDVHSGTRQSGNDRPAQTLIPDFAGSQSGVRLLTNRLWSLEELVDRKPL